MQHLRHIAIGILTLELVLAVVLGVGLMVPLPGRVEFKIVQSGSMEPTLPVGSVVVVAPAASYGVGDMITFGSDTGARIPTTHRVAAVEREGGSVRYVTKGDANEEPDSGLVSYDMVIGRVVGVVPRLGFALDFARSRNGFLVTVVIPAALIVLDELFTIAGVVRKMRRRAGRESVRARGATPVSVEAGVSTVCAGVQPYHTAYRSPPPSPPTHSTPPPALDGIRLVPRTPSLRERIHTEILGNTLILRSA